jgi:hypothetical protein
MDLQVGDRARPDVAALSAGQPGVRPPGDGPGARPSRRPRLRTLALVAFSALAALDAARYLGVQGPGAIQEVLHAGLACLLLFGVCGFGLVRLVLPGELRHHELLWILPVGACAAAVELAVLGYLRVPFAVNLGVVLAANAARGVHAVRRRGGPGSPPALREVAWPLWIGVLVACLALVPVFRAGFPTVPGYGSDAHLAVGTAHFLKGHHPGAVAPEEPVDMVPLVWRSKPPIYYPMAAVSQLTGQETWEVFATVSAILLALAIVGFFLLARSALAAGLGGAVAGMAVVGLDRVVLHVAVHPYYNQLWGLFTLPFALLLAWWAVRARSRGATGLLALFLAVGAFAYPLALPIPLIALAVLLWPERDRLRGLWHGRRSLLWMVPLAAALAVPAVGVAEKAISAFFVVVDRGRSLEPWGGDLTGFIPEHQFLSLPNTETLLVLGPLLAVAIAWELRRQPRGLGIALGGILLFGLLAALWFRPRDFGWYFHFKALAFVGPLAVLLAAVAVSRLRRGASLALAVLVLLALQGARDELAVIFDQTPRPVTALRDVEQVVPPGASIRLDMEPDQQLWAAYFLSPRPLCSQRPLTNTSYPHVPLSRRADYVVYDHRFGGPPPDAAGRELWRSEWYALHRMDPGVPGPDLCSRRMVQTVEQITLR